MAAKTDPHFSSCQVKRTVAAQRLGDQRGGPEGPEAHSANAGGGKRVKFAGKNSFCQASLASAQIPRLGGSP